MSEPLLQVENLRTYFDTPRGTAKAVDGVSFTLNKGETLAIVGESGCGKSMTALSLLQLVPEPAGFIAGGRVLFEGHDLLDQSWEEMAAIRGKDIGMIFQEPMTSLNPVFTIGNQLREALEIHGTSKGTAKGGEAENKLRESLERVGLNANIMRQYPHELSGGMRQRVMIAMALVNDPKLLIADEPTTALDVTVQADILRLLNQLQGKNGMAILLITHDLGIVAEAADRAAVMYAGQFVEVATTEELFREPRHPYTRGLFASLPARSRRGQDLATLEGIVPDATTWPPACRFEPRCPFRWDECGRVAPKFHPSGTSRPVRCHLYDPEIPKPEKQPQKQAAEVTA